MNALLRILLYVLLFGASVSAFLSAVPKASRTGSRQTLAIFIVAGMIGGAAVGASLGMLLAIEHGSIAGAVGFGTAGLFVGMITAFRLIRANDLSQPAGPSRPTVIAITAGSLAGAAIGLMLPLFVADLQARILFSFVGALLGAAAGALIGIAFEQPIVGGGFIGLFLPGAIAGVTAAWLNDDSVAEIEDAALNEQPAPTMWDQIYDREQLLDDLASGRPDAPLRIVPILWLLMDGGPVFRRAGEADGQSLRTTLAEQEPFSGVWNAEIVRPNSELRLQFEFFADSDRCTLAVSADDGIIVTDQGSVKIDGDEVTISNQASTLTMNLSDYRQR